MTDINLRDALFVSEAVFFPYRDVHLDPSSDQFSNDVKLKLALVQRMNSGLNTVIDMENEKIVSMRSSLGDFNDLSFFFLYFVSERAEVLDNSLSQDALNLTRLSNFIALQSKLRLDKNMFFSPIYSQFDKSDLSALSRIVSYEDSLLESSVVLKSLFEEKMTYKNFVKKKMSSYADNLLAQSLYPQLGDNIFSN